MKEFLMETPTGVMKTNFATSLNEITEEYIKKATAHIVPANDYAVIALISHEQLSSLVLASSRKKTFSTGVITTFVKSGKTESEFINSIKAGTKVVIDSQMLQLAQHLNVPNNVLSLNYFFKLLETVKDKDLYAKACTFNREVYFVDFKLISSVEIKAAYNDTADTKAEFVKETEPYIPVMQ